jgi:hypothetical protein
MRNSAAIVMKHYFDIVEKSAASGLSRGATGKSLGWHHLEVPQQVMS